MKRRGLILPSLLIVTLAGLVMLAGWLSRSPCSSPTPNGNRSADSLSPQEVQRWRSGQAQHWRACLLQQ